MLFSERSSDTLELEKESPNLQGVLEELVVVWLLIVPMG